MKKIIIPGGSGFLGMEVANYFSAQNIDVFILSRSPKDNIGNIRFRSWDGKTFNGWEKELEGADAVINFTGRSVDCRYNEKNKSDILNSRLDATKAIGKAVQQCEKPPQVWINAASSTIYEHSLESANSELTGTIGKGFSVDVCKAWEKTFNGIECIRTKKLLLRISIVLGKSGGAFVPIKRMTKFGLGGKQGPGNQMISWIHIQDFVRSVEWLVNNQKEGTYNIVSPGPVRNDFFMKKIRKKTKIPFGIPTPVPLLKLGAILIGTETELILKSRYVSSQKIEKEGFVFKYPTIECALDELL